MSATTMFFQQSLRTLILSITCTPNSHINQHIIALLQIDFIYRSLAVATEYQSSL